MIYVCRYKHSTNYCSNTCTSSPSANRCERLQQCSSPNQWTTSNRNTIHQWCSPISRYFNNLKVYRHTDNCNLDIKLRGTQRFIIMYFFTLTAFSFFPHSSSESSSSTGPTTTGLRRHATLHRLVYGQIGVLNSCHFNLDTRD